METAGGQGPFEWMIHKFSINNTKILSKDTRGGNTWTLMELYTQDNKARCYTNGKVNDSFAVWSTSKNGNTHWSS